MAQSITNFFYYLGNSFQNLLVLYGIDPTMARNIVNFTGLFFAGLLAVLIVCASIVSYIKATEHEPFYNAYDDNIFINGKSGAIMGFVTVICAVWFLFSIVYIYFIS